MGTQQSTPRTDREREALALLDAAVEATGGQHREGQREMVLQVARSLESRRHLLVQAGTGTGKSLAYLIPALQHAMEQEDPVVVATATLALQAQIMRRDAPRLIEALRDELPREPVVALVKGRSNYLCRHKVDGGYPGDEDAETLFTVADDGGMLSTEADDESGPTTSLGREVVYLRTWAEQTETGDRDDLEVPVTDRAWRQVSVSATDCLGASKCPVAEECFSERARANAADADVVVTNHAMLAISAFEGLAVLPEYSAVIVDEAHELQDRVTGAVTGQLSGSIVLGAATSLRRHGTVAVEDLVAAAASLDAAFTPCPSGLLATGLDDAQETALNAVLAAVRQCLSDLGTGKETETDGGRQMARARALDVLEVTERMLAARPEADFPEVVWATRPGHFEPGVGWQPGNEEDPPQLYVAPLSVAGKLREGLFGAATTVLTSATLTVGTGERRFDSVAGDVGLAGPDAPRFTVADVGSPFDYPRQGVLYVARHLPKPGRFASEESLDELERLITASRGGALGLFSSRRAAEDAAEAMRRRCGKDIEILCQGDATLSALVKQFAEEPDTCLFGTMSLWQGVDVPGPSLRLVVIDRIPFPRPDDPLSLARTRAISSHGGNGFMAVSATHAAIRLAQGAGRLIRSVQDRGVVAVLDSRLATARYGGFLASALPDFWRTTDPTVVEGVLGRLAASVDQDG
ncbi:DinG family ATP-dependent helicase YoaA [Micrococcus lylae]|uniref:ATP-dependent helicase DinG n=1 Tax=Micrococcus lylae TaxID=1273 RepID=A0A1R4IXP3_9MICC|nr:MULTISPECIES: ATP-dependent DNA helicase [Micrococcus]PNL17654.1 ATP-dependent DNA helicase [Micrococcus sp. FDAARGOS_333]TFH98215.1 ATP-dependent DNA helicase [Micrococcus lylae]SJN24681.1 DinG family ATP-dependent helicase YoaA [Micrococcus lylae]